MNAKISKQGLNDRYFPIKKPVDTFRIAVVGDSISFGWKVGGKNSFPKILEKMLNEDNRSNNTFEVINFSVPGYNTSQEYELIKEKVINFSPDLIMLIYCYNDTHICNYFKPQITFKNYLYNKSYLVHQLLRIIDLRICSTFNHRFKKGWLWFKRKILGMFYYEVPIYSYPGLEETIYMSDKDPPILKKDVPRNYWYMLGYENYKANLLNIYNLLKRHNIQFISSGFFDEEALLINQEIDIKYICDLNEFIISKKIIWDSIVIDPIYDWHFNREGHRLVADFLYSYLQEKILLKNETSK